MDLLNSTLDAVGQVGSALDKYTGGRAVRGALAGKTRELASVIPFSDTLGITNEHDATSGRDLLDHYGVTAKDDDSLGAHAAGFLADNILSPANWIGAGAAFKAAPTIAKGVSAGAKSLSGLDLADHVMAGAKGVANAGREFLANDAGSLKVPDLHAAITGFGRQPGGGIAAALAKANPTGDLPWERAVRLGKDAGVPTRLATPEDAFNDLVGMGVHPDQVSGVGAYYNQGPHNIILNGNLPEWKNSDMMAATMRDAGPQGRAWMSSDNPDSLMHHELGHAMHREALGLDEFVNSPLLNASLLPQDANYLSKKLSGYSAQDPYEAVAETVAALHNNRQFEPSTQGVLEELLRLYGGNNLWNMLGDKKLLKPLGYSLMGAGALGAASDTLPEA